MKHTTQERLKELFLYDHETGLLTRNISTGYSTKAGDIASSESPIGYCYTVVDSVKHPTHRVIWFMVHGDWPTDQIDHINGIRNDNRLINLRSVTRSENQKNMKIPKNNTSGVMGVHWSKDRNKWIVQISVGGKSKYLGMFTHKEDAIKARAEANVKYGFHANHGQR